MEAVTSEVNAHAEAAGQPPKSVDEVAMGFVRVANEAMCRPIRALTQMKVRREGAGTVQPPRTRFLAADPRLLAAVPPHLGAFFAAHSWAPQAGRLTRANC